MMKVDFFIELLIFENQGNVKVVLTLFFYSNFNEIFWVTVGFNIIFKFIELFVLYLLSSY